jgi:serine/threonine-protein kinase RCK2
LQNIRHLIRHGRQAVEQSISGTTTPNTPGTTAPESHKHNFERLIHHNNHNHNNTPLNTPINTQPQPTSTGVTTEHHEYTPQPATAKGTEAQTHVNAHAHAHGHGHGHHAEELAPFAENIVKQESKDEEARQNVSRKSIERYQMGKKLGEGAFSIVYQAWDTQSREKVAIKVIRKYQLDAKQKNSVMKEVNIMKQLNHPNVVRLIDFVENENYYYIIQELVSGGEIFNEIVKYTYFSEDLSRHVIVQVAEALLYMHETVGVVHRDLKPENIFFKPVKFFKEDSRARAKKLRKSDNPNNKLDEGKFIMNYGGGGIGLIKLGDFGLSKQIFLDDAMNQNSLKTPCGTIGYTAPEIVRDMRYSKEVDMWALGCVLYILLCGFPPFFNDSIEELTRSVAQGEFKFLSPWWDEISPGAKHCVSKLLTVNPMQRYTVAQFLQDPWILEFLNRSENLQAQAQKTQPHTQGTSSVPMAASANSSTSTTTSSMPGIKRIPSGMPGLVPASSGSGSGGLGLGSGVPAPPTTFTYSQSLLHIKKPRVSKTQMQTQAKRRAKELAQEQARASAEALAQAEAKSKSQTTNTGTEMDQEMDYDADSAYDTDLDSNPDSDSDYESESDSDSAMDTGTQASTNTSTNTSASAGVTNEVAADLSGHVPIYDHTLEPGPSSATHREEIPKAETKKIKSKSKSKSKSRNARALGMFTPEVMAMRDMFDISVAARRMHEEAALTPGSNPTTAKTFAFANAIVEEQETSDGVVEGDEEVVNPARRAQTPFSLNMNGASILARRQKKKVTV